MLVRRFTATSGVLAQLGLRHKYVPSQYGEAPSADGDAAAAGPSSSTFGSGSNVGSSSPNNNANTAKNFSAEEARLAAEKAAAEKIEAEKKAKAEADTRTPEEVKEDFIAELIKRDKELFELKRQHELSMLRVEQHQNRILQDQHDRGIYYEQSVNVHTFETITVGQYTQRNTLHHVTGLQKLRNLKIQVAILATVYVWAFLTYRYIVNPDMQYVAIGMKKIGDSSSLRTAHREEQKEKEYQEYLKRDD